MVFAGTGIFQGSALPGMPESPLLMLGVEEQQLLLELGIEVDSDEMPLPLSCRSYSGGGAWHAHHSMPMEVF